MEESRQQEPDEKIQRELPDLLEAVGLRTPKQITVQRLKKLRKQLYAKAEAENTVFVYGKGYHKSALQKAAETINGWLERLKRYNLDLHICGDRNSYCKTDHDATFMRMKEDHMKNGQLKPGYNVNVATVSEYMIGNYISADRTDTKTFIPFLEKLCKRHPVKRVVVDSGYENEENYHYVDESEQLSLFVKPADHEQKKNDKAPLEDRIKRLSVSKYFVQQRTAMEQKISTEEGILLRVNRSIQAEGVFAVVKEDMNFRRFMMRGCRNVSVEWHLISMAYNIMKLHHKIQTGRLGSHLVVPKTA